MDAADGSVLRSRAVLTTPPEDTHPTVAEWGFVTRSKEKQWSGLRESNPSDWLGKPGHYHYAKPALRWQDVNSSRDAAAAGYGTMRSGTSSRLGPLPSAST